MNAKIVDVLGTHQVYGSVSLVLSKCAKKLGIGQLRFYPNRKDIRHLVLAKTKTFSYSRLSPDKGDIYVLNSPIVFFEGWEFLFKRMPFLILEEYHPKNSAKDALPLFMLGFFKKKLFLTQIKRAEAFLQKSGFKVLLIPPAEPKKKGAKNRKHVLWVGRLVENKNPLLFLQLAEHFKNEEFVMIGGGELSEEISEKAKSLPNLKIIEKVGEREDLFKYYSEAKLLIHPAWKDPIGHVIIEALSTQTPVLASSGAGASDFLPQAWVAGSRDEKEWIEKTKAILENQEESIKKAEEVFEKEHLDIEDPYFESVADELAEAIKNKVL